jgi:hypothetical protein
MSWIEKEEKLLRVQEKFLREPMESIKCVFLFMNPNKYIEQIADEYVDLYDGKLSKERVLRLVEEKRRPKPDVKYMFVDAWTFIVDLEPEHVQSYSQMNVLPRFLTPIQILDDITIAPSIFIFHDLNAVYFLFQEVERAPAKSAIRNKATGNKITKRVTYSPQFNKTRKNIGNS